MVKVTSGLVGRNPLSRGGHTHTHTLFPPLCTHLRIGLRPAEVTPPACPLFSPSKTHDGKLDQYPSRQVASHFEEGDQVTILGDLASFGPTEGVVEGGIGQAGSPGGA